MKIAYPSILIHPFFVDTNSYILARHLVTWLEKPHFPSSIALRCGHVTMASSRSNMHNLLVLLLKGTCTIFLFLRARTWPWQWSVTLMSIRTAFQGITLQIERTQMPEWFYIVLLPTLSHPPATIYQLRPWYEKEISFHLV